MDITDFYGYYGFYNGYYGFFLDQRIFIMDITDIFMDKRIFIMDITDYYGYWFKGLTDYYGPEYVHKRYVLTYGLS